jgi:hypothetical protein
MKKTDKEKLFEAFEKVCKIKINEAYVDDDGNLQDMNFEPKFDNMVNAFCNEFALHFSDNDEDEPTFVHITLKNNNIKITDISRGIGEKFTKEQYEYYKKLINKMYKSGELKLPHSFDYVMKNGNITDINYLDDSIGFGGNMDVNWE